MPASSVKITVLGSGTSVGVPTIGCHCAVCTSTDPRDNRLRPSVLVSYDRPQCIDRYHTRFPHAGLARTHRAGGRRNLHPRARRPHDGVRRHPSVQLPPVGRYPNLCVGQDHGRAAAGVSICLRWRCQKYQHPASRSAHSERLAGRALRDGVSTHSYPARSPGRSTVFVSGRPPISPITAKSPTVPWSFCADWT